MSTIYNIYCDESAHLEHDRQGVMVLGAVWCSLAKARETAERLREIKVQHGMLADFEVKWTKVSPAGLRLYLALLDYFFDDDDLHFRALVIPDKGTLRHSDFNQTHDEWYYKMYFNTIKVLLKPQNQYRIYLDVKDTASAEKVARLHDVLRNNAYDYRREIVERVQTVRSHEVEQLQLADLLIGAVGYANRGARGSEAKLALVRRMQERSGYGLTRTTLSGEEKTNIFIWRPGGAAE